MSGTGLVQRLYGRRREYRTWQCTVKRCRETFYGTSTRTCPVHRTVMVARRRK